MELAFLTLLLKDGADRVSGCVAINNKGVFKARLTKDGSSAYSINKSLEGGFVLVFPMKLATFGTKGDECVKRGGEHTEVPNIHAIEIEEAQDCSQFPESGGSFPIFDTVNFNGIHRDMVLANDYPKIFDLRGLKLTLLRLEVQVVICQNLQNVIDNAAM